MLNLNIFSEEELTVFPVECEISKGPVIILWLHHASGKSVYNQKATVKCKQSDVFKNEKTYWVFNMDFSSGKEACNFMSYLQKKLASS